MLKSQISKHKLLNIIIFFLLRPLLDKNLKNKFGQTCKTHRSKSIHQNQPWKYCKRCWHFPGRTYGCASLEWRCPCSRRPSPSWGACPLLYRSRFQPPLLSWAFQRLFQSAIFRDRWNSFQRIRSDRNAPRPRRHRWPRRPRQRPPVTKNLENYFYFICLR